MNKEAPAGNWHKIKEIFSSALEKEAVERAAFVAAVCAGDEDLQAEVKSWLDSYTEAEEFIEKPAFSVNKIFAEDSQMIGKSLGNYQIIKKIGRGGMGAVFLAERADGEFEQKVAIKIVRQAIAESELIGLFKRERQILASLNHPNIAKLFDGGVSADGLPFLAMEFVKGEAITKFAARKNLNLEERLKLFIKVCSAVTYAHRNLVVHRDLKPSNILVTREGEPKLLDFGLAKIVDVTAPPEENQTQTDVRALTPAYASPEQLRGENVTTISDIYSLGKILSELIKGSIPENRLPDADLRAILAKVLQEELEKRYQSVEAFADDIERYLKSLPVSARPNTIKYRAEKFVKRHKVSVLAASLIFLGLIGGTVFSIWQARVAQREKEKAESINIFLEQTFKDSNPVLSNLRKNGHETTYNEVLDGAARRLESGEFDSSPELKAELEHTIADAYLGQGKYTQAREHMEKYVLLLKQLYGETHPKMMTGAVLWASLLFNKGEFDEAEKTYRQYLPLLKNEYQKGNITAENLANALDNFAYLRRTQGDSGEAESLFREALELIPKLSKEDGNYVSTTRSTLASTIADQGRFDEALETAREAVEEFRGKGETDSPSYGFSLTVYGGFLSEKGDYSNADANLREAATIFRKLLSPSALWLGDNLRNQAISLYSQGKYAEAIRQTDETLKIYDESFGKHYDHYPTALIVKGLSLTKTGQPNEGEKILREAVRIRTESLPKEHFWVALATSALGECLTIQKRYAEAEPLLSESYESLKTSQGAGNPRTLLAKSRLKTLYEKTNQAELAKQYR